MLRQLIIGSPLEGPVSRLRDAVHTMRMYRKTPEVLGDHLNSVLADHLVARIGLPGKTFVDVGGHIGSVASAALKHGAGKVIIFEAIPEKAERLKANFPSSVIHAVALGETTGEVPFFVHPQQSGYSSLDKSGDGLIEIRVPLRMIDDLVTESDVDVMKIDVEGAELGVLRGGEKMLARCRPVIMFESGPENVLGYTKEAMWEWLDGQGFALLTPDRLAHTGPPASMEVFLDSHLFPRRTTNYFAVPNERVDEIRERVRALI